MPACTCRPTRKAGANILFDHYGLNISLGGYGNLNPVSRKRISNDGTHGHLYIALGKDLLRKHNRRAILVGVEQSASFDRTGALVSLGHPDGIPDQYGGKHALGGHNRYSASGGDDFSYASKDKRTGRYTLKNPTELGDYGPGLGHYIDGMFIDPTEERFSRFHDMEFDPSIVGDIGVPPVPPRRRRS